MNIAKELKQLQADKLQKDILLELLEIEIDAYESAGLIPNMTIVTAAEITLTEIASLEFQIEVFSILLENRNNLPWYKKPFFKL